MSSLVRQEKKNSLDGTSWAVLSAAKKRSPTAPRNLEGAFNGSPRKEHGSQNPWIQGKDLKNKKLNGLAHSLFTVKSKPWSYLRTALTEPAVGAPPSLKAAPVWLCHGQVTLAPIRMMECAGRNKCLISHTYSNLKK